MFYLGLHANMYSVTFLNNGSTCYFVLAAFTFSTCVTHFLLCSSGWAITDYFPLTDFSSHSIHCDKSEAKICHSNEEDYPLLIPR